MVPESLGGVAVMRRSATRVLGDRGLDQPPIRLRSDQPRSESLRFSRASAVEVSARTDFPLRRHWWADFCFGRGGCCTRGSASLPSSRRSLRRALILTFAAASWPFLAVSWPLLRRLS